MTKPPRILVIAGSDSGGGAGIQADIKTITMLGGYAMTAITAVTAQNTLGVQAVFPLPSSLIESQIQSVLDDIGVDAIKIGMLARHESVIAVRDMLYLMPPGLPIVVDPVMSATSGDSLNEQGTAAAMHELFEFATLVTPNLPELEALGGTTALAAKATVLIKGGHGEGEVLTDRLVDATGELARWSAARIDTRHTHGTGCTLSTAIAVGLAEGRSLIDAISNARAFVRSAIVQAPGFGAGHGPLGHQAVTGFRNADEIPVMSLNQVTVGSDDYHASVEFYRRLGLRLIVDSPDEHYARFEAPNDATFSIHGGMGQVPGATTVYFECANLDERVAALKSSGVVFTQEPTDQPWLWREAELFDPFGNRILLYKAGENRLYPPWRV